jgi:hypothetical protein
VKHRSQDTAERTARFLAAADNKFKSLHRNDAGFLNDLVTSQTTKPCLKKLEYARAVGFRRVL